jgi:hypothetical protein
VKRKPNRNFLVFGFDYLMMLVLAAICNIDIWGQAAHEVLGLAIAVVFCVHIVLNRKWVAAMLRRLNKPNLPPVEQPSITGHRPERPRPKVATPGRDFWIDVALVVSFLASVASGIASSRVLFGRGNDGVWQAVHLVFVVLALTLTGVHLGRHWNWVKGVATKLRRRATPVTFWLVTAVALLALFGVGGILAPGVIAVIAVVTVIVRTRLSKTRKVS